MKHLMKLMLLIAVITSINLQCNTIENDSSNNVNSGMEIFLLKNSNKYQENLSYQNLDLKKVILDGTPLVSYRDIISYDSASHIIDLSFPKNSINIDPSVYGVPFVVTLNKTPIYGGWFWSLHSSVPCHDVVILLDDPLDSLQGNQIRFKLGYPDEEYYKNFDPRGNEDLFDKLAEDGKLN